MNARLGGPVFGVLMLLSGCYEGVDASAEGAGSIGGDERAPGASSGPESESGSGSGTDGGEPVGPECSEVARQPLRRISSSQYEAILADVLPASMLDAVLEVSTFPKTAIADGFSTFATANTVSTTESYAIEDNAEAIAALFHSRQDEFAPALNECLEPGYEDGDIDECIEDFILDFGGRLFRRPVRDDELSIVLDLYQGIASSDGARAGLTAVVHYFFAAPAFLYVTEQGVEPGAADLLQPQELAVRLALLVTNSTPDAELVAAAEEGRLQTRADIEREARRLLQSPAAVRAFALFHQEWFRGYRLEDEERNHPSWTEETQQALVEELAKFGVWFFEETDGSFQTLMTSEAFEHDPRLDGVYGASGSESVVPRRGLLATAAAMAAMAHADQTSLIQRGAFLREHILCIPLPPFPAELDTQTPLEGYEGLPTQRERLEPLMENPQCAGCHRALNPLGFAFEVYDWMGVYRERENGALIDPTAEINLGELSGTFATDAELIEALAKTEIAQRCYARHWFQYAMGRLENEADECTLDQIEQRFVESGGDVRELLVAIAVSDAFRLRQGEQGQ